MKEKILKALKLAEEIMEYCAGDEWERQATKKDREEFDILYFEIKKEYGV